MAESAEKPERDRQIVFFIARVAFLFRVRRGFRGRTAERPISHFISEGRNSAQKSRSKESMSQTFFRFLSVSALLLISVAVAHGQTEMGQISGQVTDPQGLVVPKAKLELINLDTSSKLNGE